LGLVIISFAFHHYARAQTVTDNDIYGFYNHLWEKGMAERSVIRKEANDEYIEKALSNDLLVHPAFLKKNIFTKDDLAFMAEQLYEHKNFIWSAKQLKNIPVVNDDSIKNWGFYGYDSQMNNVFTSSIPLFSLDRRRCIIYIGDVMGIIYVYKKTWGRWKKIASFMVWQS